VSFSTLWNAKGGLQMCVFRSRYEKKLVPVYGGGAIAPLAPPVDPPLGGRHDIPRPSPSVGAEAPCADRRAARRNVAVVSHRQYVPTLTAADL